MKFLVLGVSGMAGSLISLYLAEAGHEVIGFSRRKVNFVKSISGNAKDSGTLKNVVAEGKYNAVINAIGILNRQAEADKEAAVYLNGYLPHLLAKITENMETQIFHMSTDCVFSGKTGPYKENSIKDGTSFYDRSKALGELEDAKNLTFRNSIVGPDMNENSVGLLNWFMKQSGEINGYTHAMWTGLSTLELAKIMEQAAKEKAHGLINMVPDTNISKYELLQLFNKYFRDTKVLINSSDDLIIDKTLIRTNFAFNYVVPDYEKMVAEMAEWVRRHKKLYPHYKL